MSQSEKNKMSVHAGIFAFAVGVIALITSNGESARVIFGSVGCLIGALNFGVAILLKDKESQP